uniref:Uncharacterized protein n=1 Tax=Romanomermis culicivorax TaxID=13658 RepID=A0A915K7S6_ROMCU
MGAASPPFGAASLYGTEAAFAETPFTASIISKSVERIQTATSFADNVGVSTGYTLSNLLKSILYVPLSR